MDAACARFKPRVRSARKVVFPLHFQAEYAFQGQVKQGASKAGLFRCERASLHADFKRTQLCRQVAFIGGSLPLHTSFAAVESPFQEFELALHIAHAGTVSFGKTNQRSPKAFHDRFSRGIGAQIQFTLSHMPRGRAGGKQHAFLEKLLREGQVRFTGFPFLGMPLEVGQLGMPILPVFPILALQHNPCSAEIPENACAELDAIRLQKAHHANEFLASRFPYGVFLKSIAEIPADPFGFARSNLRGLALHFLEEGGGVLDVVVGLGVGKGPQPQGHQDQAQAFDHGPKVESASLVRGLVRPKVSHNACTPSRPGHPHRAPPSQRRALKPRAQAHRLQKNH